MRRILAWGLFGVGLLLLVGIVAALRLTVATDFLYHSMVKDPERTAPTGPVIVAPADGTVLYVRRITDGVIPEVIKKGVAVPVIDHIKAEPTRPLADGYLIGIFMNTQGVHVNRFPNTGTVERQIVFNGPHMDMTAAETEVILGQLVPGRVTLKKLLGMPPFDIEDKADFVLQSARETLVLRDERGAYIYIVRIADYWVGKILTWVEVGQPVATGQRLGMITWGSQTDLFIEYTPGAKVTVDVGDYVYGGETIVATY